MIPEHIQKLIPHDADGVIMHGRAAVFEIPVSRLESVAGGLRRDKGCDLKYITVTDDRAESGCFTVWYIFGAPKEHAHIVPFIRLKNTEEFPSLARTMHEAWNDERKIKTFFGLHPVGHPDPRPILLHEEWPKDAYPLRKDFRWDARPDNANGSYHFGRVLGEGIYEIPVGPIHAGIIEPGHFRFSVAGEEIVALEPRLGYTHKGSEKLFETLSVGEAVRLSEKISGDSSFSHSLAFCQALETLSDTAVPKRAAYLRVVYAELERLANHFGDIGAIMIDTGFNFGGAHGARLREIVMRIHERLSGSRFLRGVNVCGGVTKDISDEERKTLSGEIARIAQDFSEVIAVAEESTSLINRLKGTGVLPYEVATLRGVTGVAAKALGIPRDARIDFPYAAYGTLPPNIAVEKDGDVYARFRVRVNEVSASIACILRALQTLPGGSVRGERGQFKKNAVAVSSVEGWRGEILYFVTTDQEGALARVAPRDPSFVNWALLEYAGVGNVVPDFPLINKSFNLSYTGNDL